MKKTIFLLAILFNFTFISAQIMEMDILKFVQPDINGTARYTSMAGAFGALGGDASAIKDNPAGLGVYRRSDFTATLNILTQSAKATWAGYDGKNHQYNAKFDNLSYVIAYPTWSQKTGLNTGLLYSNFSFSFNRLKNFDRNLIINGGEFEVSMSDYMAHLANNASNSNMSYENDRVAWLSVLGYDAYLINEVLNSENKKEWQPELRDGERTIPTYNLKERGSVDEYSFAWSGNISNRLYLGMSLNLQTIDYLVYSTYNENFVGANDYYFTLRNEFSMSGYGCNVKMGAIYQPADFVRLGLSFQTPTRFLMSDTYNPSIDYSLYSLALDKNGKEIGMVDGKDIRPEDNDGRLMTGFSDYKMKNPMQWNASAAYFFGKKGLLSTEYVYNALGNAMLYDTDNSTDGFERQNNNMNNVLQSMHTIKIGAEYRATDNVSLRAGLATTTTATKQDAVKEMFSNTLRTDSEFFRHTGTNYITAGIGYRERYWYFDFAYMHKQLNESFMPYDTNALEAAEVTTSNNNFVATFGFRF